MGKLIGLNGQPLKSALKEQKEEAAQEGVEQPEYLSTVYATVLVPDVASFNMDTMLTVMTPAGAQKLPLQHALQGILHSLSELAHITGQNELIVSIKDNTSELVANKTMKIMLTELKDEPRETDNTPVQ